MAAPVNLDRDPLLVVAGLREAREGLAQALVPVLGPVRGGRGEARREELERWAPVLLEQAERACRAWPERVPTVVAVELALAGMFLARTTRVLQGLGPRRGLRGWFGWSEPVVPLGVVVLMNATEMHFMAVLGSRIGQLEGEVPGARN